MKLIALKVRRSLCTPDAHTTSTHACQPSPPHTYYFYIDDRAKQTSWASETQWVIR